MITIVRMMLSGVLIIVGLASLLLAIYSNPSDLSEYSFQKSQNILADFEKVAEISEDFRKVEGRHPDSSELLTEILDKQPDFKQFSIPPEPFVEQFALWVAAPGVACVLPDSSDLSDEAIEFYRLCHWRGEWIEEYVPQTKEHSLPTSLADYDTPLWIRLSFLLTAAGAFFGAFRVWANKRKVKP